MATMPLLAFDRKDMGGHSIGIEASMTANFTSRFNQCRLKALSVWRYRGRVPRQPVPDRSRSRKQLLRFLKRFPDPTGSDFA
jgi:hypothetical protein